MIGININFDVFLWLTILAQNVKEISVIIFFEVKINEAFSASSIDFFSGTSFNGMVSLMLDWVEAAISGNSYLLDGRSNFEVDGISTKFRDLSILNILGINTSLIISDFENESDLLGAVNLDWELVLG